MSDMRTRALDESLLSAYLDGELDARERAAVDTRLAESDEWRAVLDEVRAARDVLRSLPLVDASEGFWDRVLADEAAVVDHTFGARRRARLVRRMSAAVAAAAAVFGVAFVPRIEHVRPPIATFTHAHAERSSIDNDAVSTLAGSVADSALEP